MEVEITDGVFVDVKVTDTQAERLRQGKSITLNLFPDAEPSRYTVEDMGFRPGRVHIDSINHPNPAVDDKKLAEELDRVIRHERDWKYKNMATDLNYGDTAREVDESLDTGFDLISHPAHYTEGRKHEPKDVIRDWGLNFNLGSAVKYLSRAGRKGAMINDLEKAKTFIQFEIEALAEEGEEEE